VRELRLGRYREKPEAALAWAAALGSRMERGWRMQKPSPANMRVSAWLVREGETRTRQAHDVGGDCRRGVVRWSVAHGATAGEKVKVKKEK